MSDDIQKGIQEHNANRRLHILKGFVDFNDLSKGHMDFGGDKRPSNPGLVKKQITDSRGHQTTRWVRSGEDDKSKKDASNQIEEGDEVKDEQDASAGTKTPEDWVRDTPSADLMKFVDTADDSQIDLIELAEEELMNRGDIGPGANNEDEEDVYQTPGGDTLEQFYSMDEEGQRAVLQASMEHNIPLGAALAMVSQNSPKQADQVIDSAIEALQNMKSDSGDGSSEGDINISNDLRNLYDGENVEELLDKHGISKDVYESDEFTERFNDDSLDDRQFLAWAQDISNSSEGEMSDDEIRRERMEIDGDEDFEESDEMSDDEIRRERMEIDGGENFEESDEMPDDYNPLSEEDEDDLDDMDATDAANEEMAREGKEKSSDENRQTNTEKLKGELTDIVQELVDSWDEEDSMTDDGQITAIGENRENEIISKIEKLVQSTNMSEEEFYEVAKNFKGVDLVYEDYTKKK